MKAAVVSAFGARLVVARVPRPEPGHGEVLVRVETAAINPLDFHIASGEWYGLRPELPYVPGREGVGRLLEADGRAGDRVYFRYGARAGGALAEFATVVPGELAPVPEGLDGGLAAALGVAGTAAWLSLVERGGLQAGERVAVLGASGAVGSLAVQIAADRGAAVVVAVSRDTVEAKDAPRVKRVALSALDGGAAREDSSIHRVAAAIAGAAGGEIDLVIDTVWGSLAQAALFALARGGRLVNIGSSGQQEISLSSGELRGRSLSILGYTNAMYTDRLATTYEALARLALDGVISLTVESYSLDEVGEAWSRAARPPRVKVVVRP